jgi:aspartokinase-like uncharacterized kinase
VLVVKLGGSQAASPMLPAWLGAIERGCGPIVVVPGGGPFADTVRAAQAVMGFDDRAAHRMALMAMTQFALALASLAPRLALAEDLAVVPAVLAAGRVPLISAWPLLRNAPNVPESWDVTSDSLSLWVAGAIGATSVVLVKHRRAPPGTTIALAVADGLVDAAFPMFAARFDGQILVAGPDHIPAALDAAAPPGQPIRP